MSRLFDKVSGTFTSYDSSGITDSSANWQVNYYVDWYVTIDGTEYQITANTATTLSFANSLAATDDYQIAIVGRDFLEQIESDASDTTKVPSALISEKYEITNRMMHNKVFAYLKQLYTQYDYTSSSSETYSFDPLDNILNIYVLQDCFANYMLHLIFKDLMIAEDFNGFKAFEFYLKSFNDQIKDAMSLIQIDFDEDGVADADEIRTQPSGTYFFR